MARTLSTTSMVGKAVDAGIEAASNWVSDGDESFLVGHRQWSSKEYRIAEIAAREAIWTLWKLEAKNG